MLLKQCAKYVNDNEGIFCALGRHLYSGLYVSSSQN